MPTGEMHEVHDCNAIVLWHLGATVDSVLFVHAKCMFNSLTQRVALTVCASAAFSLLHNPHLLQTSLSNELCGCPAAAAAAAAVGVNPQRLLEGFSWPEFKWRRGELVRAQ
jgi:hypothetical protein